MAPESLQTDAIHATAVAIADEALVILGPSRSGKSRLAAALIARATRARPVKLIGDDRILLSEREGRLLARPHPRIAGFIERRGLGIVAMDWVEAAPVGGIIELGGALPSRARGYGMLISLLGHCARLPFPLRGGVGGGGQAVPRDMPMRAGRPPPLAPPRKRAGMLVTSIADWSASAASRCGHAVAEPDPDDVLAWWAARDADATPLRQSAPPPDRTCAKD